MQYARQVQDHLERLNGSLAQLREMIKRNENAEAIRFMNEGGLKERYEELQNIINISVSSNYGTRGVQNTGTL